MFLIKHFITSTIHLSQKTNKWNPRISYFLLGIRDNIFVIDLEQTLIMMKRALTFVKQVGLTKGYIFYIPPTLLNYKKCLNKKIKNNFVYPLVEEKFFNKKIEEINNLTQINNLIFISHEQNNTLYTLTQKRNILGLNPMIKNYNIDVVQNATISNKFVRKDKFIKINSIQTIENNLTTNLWLKPQVLFICQTNKQTAIIKEAIKYQIPIIGILNNNSKSYGIQYPIPGNDNSIEAFNLYMEMLISALISVKKNEIKSFLT